MPGTDHPGSILGQDLSVVTPKNVYTWSRQGVARVFESRRDSIVSAKRNTVEGDLIAVADGQVVFLHDIRAGSRYSHRFKEEEQACRSDSSCASLLMV